MTPHHQDLPQSGATNPQVESGDSEATLTPEAAVAKPQRSVEDVSETDATVITHGPPIGPQSSVACLHPRELGNALEGQWLDHFELVEFVGGGGMGAVFRAHDTLLDRIVAVKVLASGQAENDENRLRFRNEAQSAARLDHANIARVHFVGVDKGVHYIVFEYIEGVNIRDLVHANGPLSAEQALSYTLQIAEALAHAGERDVVHRDIKPSNILVTSDGQAKLVDMGLARMRHLGDRDELTATGVTLGTFDYISPEQARDPRNADTRSDIYSLGCTLFFMLCGAPPFPDGTVLQKLLQHQEDIPPDLRSHRGDLGPEVSAFVRTMLAKAPEDRYQSPAELIANLVAKAEQAGIRLSRPVASAPLWVGAPAKSSIRHHLPWIVPAMILIFCVFLFDAVGRRNDMRIVQPERVEPPSVRRTADPPPIGQDKRLPPRQPTSRSNGFSEPVDDVPRTAELTGDPGDSARKSTQAEKTGQMPRPPSADSSDRAAIEAEWRPSPVQQAAALAPFGCPYGGITAPANVLANYHLHIFRVATTAFPSDGVNGRKSDSQTTEIKKPRDGQDIPLVVTANGHDGTYSTLGEACRAAESGQVIELHYTGPLTMDGAAPVWETPINVGTKHLTIRAGDQFQPLIRFRPMQSDRLEQRPGRSERQRSDRPGRSAGGVRFDRRDLESPGMITISGGALRLVHLDLEVDFTASGGSPIVPQSFVAVERAESIIISGCRVTVRSGRLPGTAATPVDSSPAFFSLEQKRTDQEPTSHVDPDHREPTRIRLDNCVLRGDAVLIRATTAIPIDLAWSNGLFATNRHLVERTLADPVAGDRSAARIELTHVTAVLALGVIKMPAGLPQDFGRPLAITCQDSLIVGQPTTVLVDQPTANQLDADQEAFIWRGERTFYHGVEVFWRLGSAANVPLQLGFDGWRDYWVLHPRGDEIHTVRAAIHWKRQPSNRVPLDGIQINDYVIDDSEADFPELNAASDGGPVGMRFNLLPTFGVISSLQD